MKTIRALLLMTMVWQMTPAQDADAGHKALLSIWRSPKSSPEERIDAITKLIPRGTSVNTTRAILGERGVLTHYHGPSIRLLGTDDGLTAKAGSDDYWELQYFTPSGNVALRFDLEPDGQKSRLSFAQAYLVEPLKDNSSVSKVSIEELLKNKEKWKGKRVEVSGFYVTGPEVSALYESEVDARTSKDEKSLWIDYRDGVAKDRRKLKWIKRGFIRIVGTFEFRADLGSGNLNQWPAKINRIELVEPTPDPARLERGATHN